MAGTQQRRSTVPGRERLQEIVNDAATEIVDAANRLAQAAEKPGR